MAFREPDFDTAAAHHYFAAYCFNAAWDLIEKPDRTADDDRMMLALAYASMFHWSRRPDCDDRRRAVGHWQASRVQALLGQGDEAWREAETCLGLSGALAPFHLGYAYEALARAALVRGDEAQAATWLEKARTEADQVIKAEDRALLAADLQDIGRLLKEATSRR